jgi:hypothetical protein
MLHTIASGGGCAADTVLRGMFAARKTCLRHAPTPLAASGLDMRVGHPAAQLRGLGPSSEVLTPRRQSNGANSDYVSLMHNQVLQMRSVDVLARCAVEQKSLEM